MEQGAYTAETICHSMGLPSFIEKRAGMSMLRLLLRPVIDPEVCLTICQTKSQPRLSVIVLQQSLRQQPAVGLLDSWREEVSVSEQRFKQLLAEFSAAQQAELELPASSVALDGLIISACRSQRRILQQFETAPYRPLAKAFVTNSLTFAWETCRFSRVRNALAICGNYLGMKLPLQSLKLRQTHTQTISRHPPEDRIE